MIAKLFGDRISKDEIVTISDLMAQAYRRENVRLVKSVPDSVYVEYSFYAGHYHTVKFIIYKQDCEVICVSFRKVRLPGESLLECYNRLLKEEFMFILE